MSESPYLLGMGMACSQRSMPYLIVVYMHVYVYESINANVGKTCNLQLMPYQFNFLFNEPDRP